MVLQSKIFVVVLALLLAFTLIVWFGNFIIYFFLGTKEKWAPLSAWRCILALLLPLIIAKRALKNKSLDSSGAATALVIGFIMVMANFGFMSAMLVFFFVGSKATKWRAEVKCTFEADYRAGGQRNWTQVLCNGGVAAQFALLYIVDVGSREYVWDYGQNYNATWYCSAVLGALACCCGDTLASEVGSAVGGARVRLLTSPGRLVPRGTNGGVTLLGTICSALGGFLVGLAYYLTMLLMFPKEELAPAPSQLYVVLLTSLAGLLGSLVDSFLGATCQYSGMNRETGHVVEVPGDDVTHISGCHLLDNHAVNLLSALVTALVTPRLGLALQGRALLR